MNILANVGLVFGLALSPGNPLFDVVSVELDRLPVQATSLTSTATPASANWVAPNASATSSATATATPATANWIAPNASASSSATATATPASASWVAPNASASSAVTATATPASAVWVAPNASSSMQTPWIYSEGLCVHDLLIAAETVSGLEISADTVDSLALEVC